MEFAKAFPQYELPYACLVYSFDHHTKLYHSGFMDLCGVSQEQVIKFISRLVFLFRLSQDEH